MTALPRVVALSAEPQARAEESPWRLVLRRFRRHRLAMVSVFVIAAIFVISLLAAQISPFSPNLL